MKTVLSKQILARYPDGQGYTWLYFSDGTMQRKHRYVMEQELGRKLRSDEVVHHKDEDKSNDRPDNLELKTRAQHTAEHSVVDSIELKCVRCELPFNRKPAWLRSKVGAGQTRFFCTNECAVADRCSRQVRTRTTIRCAVCDIEFEIKNSEMRRRTKQNESGRLTCSRECGSRLGRSTIRTRSVISSAQV